jgi:hypothetical protein
MQRQLVVGALMLAAACAEPAGPPVSSSGTPTYSAVPIQQSVLLLSGDSHDYRVDAGVPWFSLYGVTPPANVTQIIVDRSIEDDTDWLRLHVDPKSSEVFSWEQVFGP